MCEEKEKLVEKGLSSEERKHLEETMKKYDKVLRKLGEISMITAHKECYKNKCEGCTCRNCNDFNECDSSDKKCGYCKHRQTYTVTWPYQQSYTAVAPAHPFNSITGVNYGI